MSAQTILKEWIEEVEDGLPWDCPKCDGDLQRVRYVTDCTRTTIHLTAAVNETAIHKALCPHCSHVLAEASAGERRWR